METEKAMTTKEWFSRGRRLDAHIHSLLETRDKLWTDLTSTTARYTGDVVNGTKDPHKYDGLVALDAMIDGEIGKLFGIKQEILSVILQMQDVQYQDVLMKRYVDVKTWERIAVEMNYTYRRITQIHGAALAAAGPLIQNKEHVQDV